MLPPEQLMAIKAEVAKRLNKHHLAHTTIEFEFPDEGYRDA
ncbi:MAG: cobalt-zinc-cadmium efflux system protein [Paraglaciecola sp.]|jgi:hypothetical protein